MVQYDTQTKQLSVREKVNFHGRVATFAGVDLALGDCHESIRQLLIQAAKLVVSIANGHEPSAMHSNQTQSQLDKFKISLERVQNVMTAKADTTSETGVPLGDNLEKGDNQAPETENTACGGKGG
jgi:hypothetical protein